jgi:hypothetical protein
MQYRAAVPLIIALLLVAACSSSGSSGGGSIPGGDGTGGSMPGGTFGDVVPPPGALQPVEPVPAEPAIVTPQPGQANLHTVNPYELSSRIDGTGHVIVRVRWWGGIEPCETLDSVIVTRDGARFSLAVRVGAPAGLNVACIEIARDTATIVDLGVLAPGTYSVRADPGDAAPLTIAVP